jgi:hypothetical protein
MKRTRTAVALLVLLTSTTPAFAQQTSSTTAAQEKSRWNVFYPLAVWMPLFGVDVTLPVSSPCPGCESAVPEGSGSSKGLSGAFFGGVRFEFVDRFEVLANYNYAGLTASRETPFFRADVQLTLASVMGGVRVVGPVFVQGGARYHGLDATFTVRTFPAVDWNPGEWSPAFGAGFRTAVRDDWRVYGVVSAYVVPSEEPYTVASPDRVNAGSIPVSLAAGRYTVRVDGRDGFRTGYRLRAFSADSAPEKPVEVMSASSTACSSETPSGMGARFAAASGTSRYSACAPSIVLPNRQPPSALYPASRPHCEA